MLPVVTTPEEEGEEEEEEEEDVDLFSGQYDQYFHSAIVLPIVSFSLLKS